jgi:putative transposase
VPKAYAPEFRRKVLDLVAAGRPVAQVAQDLEISEQVIYNWRRQQLIDTGQLPGTTSSDHAELVAARKRIAELKAELAIHRKAAELLGDVVPQKTVRSDLGDRRLGAASAARDAGAGGLGVGLLRMARPGALGAQRAACVANRADHAGPCGLARHLRCPAGARRAHLGPGHHRRARHGGTADAPGRDQGPARHPPAQAEASDPTAGDLVHRQFTCTFPDQLWVTDITEHPTREGKVYCAVVLDAWSRRVVGWSIDSTQTAALVTSALDMAIRNRDAQPGVVIHSDHGTQLGFRGSSQHLRWRCGS